MAGRPPLTESERAVLQRALPIVGSGQGDRDVDVDDGARAASLRAEGTSTGPGRARAAAAAARAAAESSAGSSVGRSRPVAGSKFLHAMKIVHNTLA